MHPGRRRDRPADRRPVRPVAVGVSGLLPEPAGYAELLEQLKARVRTSQVRAARAATASCCSCTGRSAGRSWTRRSRPGGAAGSSTGSHRTCERSSRTSGAGRGATCTTCGPSPRPGQPPKASCHRPWHNCRGARFGCCSTSSAPVRSGTGTPRPRASTAGPGTYWPTRSRRGWLSGSGRRRRTSRMRCPGRTRSLPSSWCATRTCSTTWRCPKRVAERELEQALIDRLQQTLLAFGHGMAFVGRQVRRRRRRRRAGAGPAAVQRRSAALCRRTRAFGSVDASRHPERTHRR